jgi:hypothetical protein
VVNGEVDLDFVEFEVAAEVEAGTVVRAFVDVVEDSGRLAYGGLA